MTQGPRAGVEGLACFTEPRRSYCAGHDGSGCSRAAVPRRRTALCAAEVGGRDGARVWGRAGRWEGAQGIAGGLKEAGRRSRRGSKEGSPGDLGGIQARALRCGGEDGADKWAPLVSGEARGAAERGERAGLRGWLAGPAGRQTGRASWARARGEREVRAGRAVRRKGLRRGLLAREERNWARREGCGPQGREGETWAALGRFGFLGWVGFLFI
jgi:hypothetical protein